ncbi:MAG: DedA family protein [Candidatus Manganitrophaceae bacterium]
MSFTDLLRDYGLWGVLIGTFFEGEGVMLMAGGLAHQQIVSPWGAWLIGALGAYLGHLVHYGLGYFLRGKNFLNLIPRWRPKIERALPFIRRYPVWSIFVMQYLYGVRIVGAVAMGLAGMPWLLFFTIQSINCLIWSAVIFVFGYGATAAVSLLFPWSDRGIVTLLIAVLLATAVLYFFIGRGGRWGIKSEPEG